MSDVITGLFENQQDASAAIHSLEHKGVDANDISLVANESLTKDSFAVTDSSKLPEGFAIGAASGGALAAIVAGLTAVGTVATGGVGLLASGPLVAALAAGGAGAAAGGLVGGAIGFTIPEHEIKYYEDAIEKGAVLVGVNYENDDIKDLIKQTFETFDATKVSSA
ncbi:hypothetical protein [Colwellia sp. PAMC 21821]|uniref:hypothetical protein n=1 Tax=Colwellia sp. PAMC 21821 TaxID=1816219 RepID=UPI0009C015E2|nr:hypothetical protein [Colwellia sp. PAMC 21821]ARD43690.1 hypothetical protein A3Q33_04845 [Colwellia sp. PAMC 21821]